MFDVDQMYVYVKLRCNYTKLHVAAGSLSFRFLI